MEITKIKKGQRAGLPCSIVGGNEGFAHNILAPCDGIFMRLEAGEGVGGGIFVPAGMLESVGYVSTIAGEDRVKQLVELFDRSELVEMSSRLSVKVSGTKQTLAARILHKF